MKGFFRGFFKRAIGIDFFHWLFGDNYWIKWFIIILIVVIACFLYYRIVSNDQSDSSKDISNMDKRFRSLVYTLYGSGSADYVTDHIISKNKSLEYGGLSRGEGDCFLLQLNEYWYKRSKDGTPLTEEKLKQLNEELFGLFESETRDVPKIVTNQYSQYVIIEFLIYDDEYLGDILSKFKLCKSFADAHFDKWNA